MTTQIKGPKLLYQRIKVLDKKGKKIAYEWFKNKKKDSCVNKTATLKDLKTFLNLICISLKLLAFYYFLQNCRFGFQIMKGLLKHHQ